MRRCGTKLGRELRLGVGRMLDAREGAPLQLECKICGLAEKQFTGRVGKAQTCRG